MAINIGKDVVGPSHSFGLIGKLLKDGLTGTMGFITCDQQGKANVGAGWTQAPMPRTPLKISQGNQGYDDFELPFTSIEMKDWSGGMNAENFEDDRSRYRDGRFADTTRGDIVCGPKETSTLEAYKMNTDGDLSYTNKRINAGQTIYSTYTPSVTILVRSVTIPVDVNDTFASVTIYSETSPGSGVINATLAYGQETLSGATSVTIELESSVSLTAATNYLVKIYSEPASGSVYYYTRPETGETVYRTGLAGWAETQPVGDVNKNWRSCAMSSDGSVMLAGVYNGRLYLYSGGTWAETRPAGDVDQNWLSCAISSDGSVMLAGASAGRLYLYTAAGNFTNTQMAFLMNYADTNTIYWRFYKYRRAVYALGNVGGGGAPILYINGYRGAGKTNSTDLSKLNTDQNLSGANLTGCIVLIIEGPGVKEVQPWRIIKSNTTTGINDVISVEKPWEIAHTTATSWVVLGSDDWIEITGHGLTGTVTDIEVLKDYVLFAQGEDINMRRMNEYNNSGAWTRRYEADGTNKGDLILVIQNTEGKEMVWKARVDANDVRSAEIKTWGTAHVFGDVIPTGSKDSDIKGLIAYGDPLIPYVLKEDSFGSIQNDIYGEMPIGEMAAIRSEYNGIASMMHNVYLYFNMGEMLQRYYDRRLDNVGPDRDEGLPRGRQGIIRKLLPYPGRFYSIVYTEGRTPSILCFNSLGWNEIWRGVSITSDGSGATGEDAPFAYNILDQANVRVNDMAIQVIPGDIPDRIWFDHGSVIKRLPITINPRTNATYQYRDLTMLQTAWIYGNLKDVDKYWHSIKLHTENLTGTTSTSRIIKVEFQVDNDTTWTKAGYINTSPIQEIMLSDNYDITGHRIRFRFTLHTDNVLQTPRIIAAVVKGVVRVEVKKGFAATVIVTPTRDLRDQPEEQTGIKDQLEAWADSDQTPAPLTLVHNLPEFDGLKVFIDPASFKITKIDLEPTKGKSKRDYIVIANFTLYEV